MAEKVTLTLKITEQERGLLDALRERGEHLSRAELVRDLITKEARNNLVSVADEEELDAWLGLLDEVEAARAEEEEEKTRKREEKAKLALPKAREAKERHREQALASYHKNKAKHLEARKKYREEHAEEIKAYADKYYHETKYIKKRKRIIKHAAKTVPREDS